MITGLYKAASAIETAEVNHEVISRNLAYMDTPGYRRSIVSFEQQVDELSANQSPWGQGIQTPVEQKDFSQGQLQVTDRSLDVAIEGDGFFVLETPRGEAFTRAGVFFVGQDRELVTAAGYPVQGEGGPIAVPAGVSPNEIKIGTDGVVFARNSQIGQIQLVRFEDNDQLQPIGIALFSGEDAVRLDAEQITVLQGARERSNVSATVELNRMIVGMRHQQAAQQALRQISDALEQHSQGG